MAADMLTYDAFPQKTEAGIWNSFQGKIKAIFSYSTIYFKQMQNHIAHLYYLNMSQTLNGHVCANTIEQCILDTYAWKELSEAATEV